MLTALLTGCGGGGDEGGTDTRASTEAQSAPQPTSADNHKGSKDSEGPEQSPEGSQGSTKKPVNAAPLKVSGGGSEQFEVKGGDNSVQEYGEEAGELELRDAAELVHSFYVARVAEEWSEACSYLAQKEIQSLEAFAAQAQLKGKGCAQALDLLTKTLAPSLQRQITIVDAHALRREGAQGFLIYTGPPQRTVYSMPLNSEGGAWKLGAIGASALPGA